MQLFYSEKVSQQKKLKTEILANKKDLLQTSAQDQFAKWAKLRRSVDKGLSDLEKLSELLVSYEFLNTLYYSVLVGLFDLVD